MAVPYEKRGVIRSILSPRTDVALSATRMFLKDRPDWVGRAPDHLPELFIPRRSRAALSPLYVGISWLVRFVASRSRERGLLQTSDNERSRAVFFSKDWVVDQVS